MTVKEKRTLHVGLIETEYKAHKSSERYFVQSSIQKFYLRVSGDERRLAQELFF